MMLGFQEILNNDFANVNADWAADVTGSLNSWRVEEIPSKGYGIVASTLMRAGTYVCVYGGTIFDVTKAPSGACSHVLQLKETSKSYAIDGQNVQSFPKKYSGCIRKRRPQPEC